jgi:hypothetical protein
MFFFAVLLQAVVPALSVTQGGAGSPPPLVEVNQAIKAWSFFEKRLSKSD